MKSTVKKNFRTASIMMAVVAVFIAIMFFTPTVHKVNAATHNVKSSETNNIEDLELVDTSSIGDSEEIFSYKTVFREYYDKAKTEANKNNNEICSFEEFCDRYYDSGLDLMEYVTAVAYNNLSEITENNLINETQSISVAPFSSSSSSSITAGYILSATDYGVTPASEFLREPLYGCTYSSLFSTLQNGDIVYEQKGSGHIAVIYDVSKQCDDGRYIQTIEAVGGNRSGVQFGFLDDERIVDFKVMICRVVGKTNTIVNQAKAFLHEQLGKPYDLFHDLHTSISSREWYCSELAYAAYLYAGIDIIVKKNGSGNDTYPNHSPLLPADIEASYNTKYIGLYVNYLVLENAGKDGSYWNIRVRNPRGAQLTIEYNTKMCYKRDGQAWNLKDVVSIQLTPSGTTVKVKTNFAAGYVAFSYCVGDKRLITVAHNLDKNGNISLIGNTIDA